MDKMTDSRAAEAQAQGGGGVVAWVSRHDAMFSDAGNWRYTNPVLCSSQESPDLIPLYTAPPSAPVGVEGGFAIDADDSADYIEHCAKRLDLYGQRVAAAALRAIAGEHRALARALAAQPGGSDNGR